MACEGAGGGASVCGSATSTSLQPTPAAGALCQIGSDWAPHGQQDVGLCVARVAVST